MIIWKFGPDLRNLLPRAEETAMLIAWILDTQQQQQQQQVSQAQPKVAKDVKDSNQKKRSNSVFRQSNVMNMWLLWGHIMIQHDAVCFAGGKQTSPRFKNHPKSDCEW